jgi:hypothetical protein
VALSTPSPKRKVYDKLYEPLYHKWGLTVLDVGCGEIDPELTKRHDYTGVDLSAGLDWYEFSPDKYDLIISNDLFPNVDQRLELFLDKYVPCCDEMRLSLTYHNEPRWYRTRRVDGGEMLTHAGLE